MSTPLIVGAVAYTPNVVTIWEGIRDYFADSPAEMDFVLFSNYGRQVDSLIESKIDLAWNTNLAWVRTVAQTDGACRALAMRDTDTVFQTMFVTRTGSALAGVEALRGRRLALGSQDSAQAAILPIHFLDQAGLGADGVELLRINSDVGKHGDTGRSELDALRLGGDRTGRADAWRVRGVLGVPDLQPLQLYGPTGAVRRTLHCLGRSPARDGLGQPGASTDLGGRRPSAMGSSSS